MTAVADLFGGRQQYATALMILGSVGGSALGPIIGEQYNFDIEISTDLYFIGPFPQAPIFLGDGFSGCSSSLEDLCKFCIF